MDAGWFLWGAMVGFWWGGWWARRRPKPSDPATQLLTQMVSGVRDQRKFVGEGTTITRFEHFEVWGEQFTLSVQSDGKPVTQRDAA